MSEEDRGHRWFAAIYDRTMRAGERRVGPMRRELLGGLTGDVLEIGAGTGANFSYYKPGARVIALEPDPHMLKRAQARLATLGRTNIDVQRAPAEALPFDADSFDVVVSTLVLCTVNDLAASLAELRRVLRPGGRLVFIEHVRGNGALGHTHDLIQPVWGWCSAGCQVNRRTEAAMADAGFAFDEIRRLKLAPWMPAIVGAAHVATDP
ncbi:MAG: class I SAM-dependent methyltransferase [Dehalococcoidia bacterium]|nr:MAG: class I SAM-dependent methyltransferase [Dehalococcoidia bacterium]